MQLGQGFKRDLLNISFICLPVYFRNTGIQARHQGSIVKRTLKKYENFMTINFQVFIKIVCPILYMLWQFQMISVF